MAAPAANGLLCWAKPAGTVPYGPPKSATTDVAWDAVWWWARPDGLLQLLPSSRFTKNPELLAPYQVNTPLWAAHTIVVDPKIPRTDEATGTEDAHPFVSVVGAAWLLMSQTNITETRQTEPTNSPEGTDPVNPGRAREPSSVTIVELRRELAQSAARRRGSLAGSIRAVGWWVGPMASGANRPRARA